MIAPQKPPDRTDTRGAFVCLIEIVPITAPSFTSAVATLIDVLVFGHAPLTEQPRGSLRPRRSG